MTTRPAVPGRRRPASRSARRPWTLALAGLFACAAARGQDDAAADAADADAGRDAAVAAVVSGAGDNWSINPGRVLLPPTGPYPLELDGETYLVFPVSFQPETVQDILAEAYRDILATAAQRDADAEARLQRIDASEAYENNQQREEAKERIRQELARRKAELPALQVQLERLSAAGGRVRRPQLAATLHTEGRVFRDLADEAVRNLYERRADRRFYTSVELGRHDLKELRTRRAYVDGRLRDLVDVLLVFPQVHPVGRRAELRLAGLGNAAFPRFEPGALMYTDNLIIKDPSSPSGQRFYDPALRQVLRADYEVSGGEYRPRYRLERVRSDWLWIWPARLYAGHVRTVDVPRGPGDAARRMWYAPVLFVNDTARPQPFTVRAAGIFADVAWQGMALRARFTDGADPDAYATALLMRQVAERVESGDEYSEVKRLEDPALAGVNPESDLRLKADVLPRDADGRERPRLPVNETLAPRTRRRGLVAVRARLDNLDEIVEAVATRLWLFQTLAETAPTTEDGEPAALFEEYRALHPGRPEGLRDEDWLKIAPPEPPADRVERLALARARADLAARDARPDAEDARLYNHHRFVHLADDMILDWAAFAKAALAEGAAAADGAANAPARLRACLNNAVKGLLAKIAEGGRDAVNANQRAVVLDAVNQAIDLPDLFGAAEFAAAQGEELRELVDRGRESAASDALPNLSPAERRKVNRLLLDEMAPEGLQPCLDRDVLGRLLNILAAEAVAARAEQGYTDLFFAVDTQNGPEEAGVSLAFRRYIPPLFPPYRIPDAVRAINPTELGGEIPATP